MGRVRRWLEGLESDVWSGLIVLLGLALLGVPIYDVVTDVGAGMPLLASVVENAVRLVLALIVVGAGIWMFRKDWEQEAARTVGLWTVAVFVCVGGLIGSIVAIQVYAAGELEPMIIAADGVVVATVAGLGMGWRSAQHRRTQMELATERDRFQELYDNMPAAAVDLVVEDGDLRTTDRANQQFVAHFGFDPERDPGRSLFSVVEEVDPETVAASREAAAAGDVYRGVVTWDEGEREQQFQVRIVPYRVGSRERAFALFHDITALARVQAELEETVEDLERSNDRLQGFASVISHDLRNPLTVAHGRVELLAEEYESDSLAVIDRMLDRMEAIIEDVLTLARGTDIEATEAVDLAVVAAEAWSHVETPAAELVTDGSMTVEADRRRTLRLLENCFANAVEHAGREVTVEVGSLSDGFYVADDGPGIDRAEPSEVFEAGVTTSDEGTGLGLMIVHDIATAHGWTVAVTESAEGGARFEFTGVERD
jgi:signal transduction histidine kinase